MHSLPCFLCGQKLEKRTSNKNGKPYFVCDRCGIQLFIRRKHGIEKLEQLLKNSDRAQIPYVQHTQNFHKVQAILKEISDLRSEIEKLGFIFFDEDKSRTRK